MNNKDTAIVGGKFARPAIPGRVCFCPATRKRLSTHSLTQWFLTFFTYVVLLSNKTTRFTLSTLNGTHLLKIRNKQTFTV